MFRTQAKELCTAMLMSLDRLELVPDLQEEVVRAVVMQWKNGWREFFKARGEWRRIWSARDLEVFDDSFL